MYKMRRMGRLYHLLMYPEGFFAALFPRSSTSLKTMNMIQCKGRAFWTNAKHLGSLWHILLLRSQNSKWEPPDVGWIKLNTNGPYLPTEGSAATHRVLRDSSGAIIFTACRNLIKCDNALELELSTISQGVSLALQWSNLLINVESG